MPKTVPELPGLEPGDLPFSKVVEANGFVFLAGQVGDAPGSARRRARRHRGRDARDARQRRPPAAGGRARLRDVVECTVYLRDFAEFAAMNAVYREYFPAEPPARATVGVTALAADYRVEIEVIAAR